MLEEQYKLGEVSHSPKARTCERKGDGGELKSSCASLQDYSIKKKGTQIR